MYTTQTFTMALETKLTDEHTGNTMAVNTFISNRYESNTNAWTVL